MRDDSSATEEINKLLALHPGSQVLSVQVQRDLSVQRNPFDTRTQQETAKILKCTDCADKDVLISRVQPEVALLLERCLAQSCAAPAARPGGAEPPPDACEPWPLLDCEDAKQLATAAPSHIVYQGLPPRTAKTLQALAWGSVAATAATGVITLGLGPASAGEHRGPMGESIHSWMALDSPHWESAVHC